MSSMKSIISFLIPVLFITLFLYLVSPITAQEKTDFAHTIQLQVTEKSWIEVIVDGSLLYNGVIESGSWRVWIGDDIYLRIDNASGVEVTHNERSLGILGDDDEVVTRHWKKDSASLLESPLTPLVHVTPEVKNQIEQAIPRPPSYYLVTEGQTLYSIARNFNIHLNDLMALNHITDSRYLQTGQQLIIPGSDGSLPETEQSESPDLGRKSLLERLTLTSRLAAPNSPFHKTTWLTFYGRPNVPVMGILGEYSIEALIPVMRAQAEVYDEANGPDLAVMPAFHLVYGMATREPGEEGNYLSYLEDHVVTSYIQQAQAAGLGVILDVQVGGLSPVEAMERAFTYLHYDNVHLALDPEFAMSHPNQTTPGVPIGFITAEQINSVQAAMRQYMKENKISGRRMFVLHQFLDTMIINKEQINRVYKIDLTITADGWGAPWAKIGKYNAFIDKSTKFAGIKLFYRWDDPVMSEREILGIDKHPNQEYINITPNLIIYQ